MSWLYDDTGDDEMESFLHRLGYNKPKENKMLDNLFNRDTLMNSFFRKVDDTVWDLSTGKIGMKTKEGIATLGDGDCIDINPIESFGIPLPSFATKTSFDKVAKGDFLYGSTAASRGWVTDIIVSEGGDGNKSYKFTILTPNGTSHNFTPPRVKMFGLDPNGVMIVQNLLNMTGTKGADGLKNSLLPLMMMGGDMEDIGDILPVLLFSGMNGGGGSDMSSMMTQMMMMKMLGSNKKSGSTGLGGSYFEGNRRNGGR
jgi:hypothetical protein